MVWSMHRSRACYEYAGRRTLAAGPRAYIATRVCHRRHVGVEVRGDLWDCLSFNSQPAPAPIGMARRMPDGPAIAACAWPMAAPGRGSLMGLRLAATVCGALAVHATMIAPRSRGGVTCGKFVAGDACEPNTNDRSLSSTSDPAVCRAQCEAQGGSGCCYFRPPNSALPHECQWNAGGSPSHVGGPTIRSATKCNGPPPPPPPATLAPHEQLHIAFGDTDDSLVVTWASLCYPCNQSAVLHWALATDSGTLCHSGEPSQPTPHRGAAHHHMCLCTTSFSLGCKRGHGIATTSHGLTPPQWRASRVC
jgi:hypothetical protein